MRYFVGAEMGWLALPFIVAAVIAYTWLADRLIRPKATPQVIETKPAVTKAA